MTVISRAAEHAPAYGAASPAAAIPWPIPGDVLALRRQVESGIQHLDEGRHAPGERDLRQAIGGLTRRSEWASAADASLALAASLVKRGRPRDARAVIDAARESCRKAPGDRMLIAAATLSGTALVDLGRLDEAETVLAAAHTVATHGDDRGVLPPVALALARCRFWRGQYADARDALGLLLDKELDDGLRVRADLMRARLAIADDDVAGAVGLCAGATERAAATGRSDLVARAAYGSAFARLAAGDLDALRRDVAVCTRGVSTSRDPLRQLRAQLLLCELLRRTGARDEALKAFARLRRVPASALPRLVKCRRDMLGDLLLPDANASDIVARLIAGSGVHALALIRAEGGEDRTRPRRTVHANRRRDRGDARLSKRDGRVDDADAGVRAGAAAGAGGRARFLRRRSGGLARLASRGPRLEPATAQRAIDASIFIAPHQVDERVEAAMPVRYGGGVIGALGIRWVIGSTP